MSSVETYRKRPIEVQAVKWDGEPGTIKVLRDFVPAACLIVETPPAVAGEPAYRVRVVTVDGNITIVPDGAYVIIDAKGYPYPCDAGVFEATHDRVVHGENVTVTEVSP